MNLAFWKSIMVIRKARTRFTYKLFSTTCFPSLFINKDFHKRVKEMSIKEVIIAPRSPWQNPFAEGVIGSIRRECLDHLITLGENHLHQILFSYFRYYNNCFSHLSLDRNSPSPRNVEPPSKGKVISIPEVGGLHHRYSRVV